MKQIAVIGSGGQSAAASLIGTVLHSAAGWKVGVLDLENGRGDGLKEGLDRLARQGCDCAVAALGSGPVDQIFQVGVLTGWSGGARPAAVDACQQLVVNLDDDCGRLVAGQRPSLTYSEGKDKADLTAKYLRCYPTRTEFDALTWKEIRRVRLPVLGGYDLYQGLAALGCGLSLGLPLDSLARSVEEAAGLPGHLEEFKAGLPFRIVLDQAATAAELESLLLTLRPLREGKGRLRLLMGTAIPGEKNLMGAVARDLADQVIPPQENRERGVEALLEAGRPGDVLVLSGVHRPGSEADERIIIRQWLERKRRDDRA